MAEPALAQTSIPAPPVFTAIDAKGVDLSSGKFNAPQLSVAVGPAAGGLTYVYRGPMGRDSFAGTVNSAPGALMGNPVTYYTVSIGNSSAMFLRNSGAPTIGTFIGSVGQSLTYDAATGLYTHTALDGAVAVFSTALTSTLPNAANAGNIISLTRPSGETLTYAYKACGTGCQRLQSVSSNRGYMIKYEYSNGAVLSKVTALNRAVDACDPAADTCSFSRTWPYLSFASAADGSSVTVTDALSRATTYGLGAGKITSIQRPGVNAMAVAYNALDRVQSVSNGVGTWAYTYVDYNGGLAATVTSPQGRVRTVNTSLQDGHVYRDDDAGNATTYLYYTNGLLRRITQPEGNYTEYTYEGANVTAVTQVAKPSSGLASVAVTATYAESFTCSNPKTCHKPVSVTDERGNVTNYTYDSVHGGVLTVTSPAPTAGVVQPQIRVKYGAFQAWYKNSAGTLVAGSTIYLPTATSQCSSQGPAVGTAPAPCVGAGDEAKTTLVYDAGNSGLGGNLTLSSTTAGGGDGAVSATTVNYYNALGDVIAVDGPLAGTADTTRNYYDLGRQVTGVIGPDPDGSGPLLYRASRIAYNDNGQATSMEVGTAVGQTEGSMSSFVALQRTDTAYDTVGRKISDSVVAGGAVQGVTQYGYDTANRLICQTVRMNPAAFASAPGACSLGATGSDGPDRITYTVYDNADRATQVISGYGTTAPRIEWTTTYTTNGRQLTVADGKGNTTTYEYDGFDRLAKTRYPNISGVGSSVTDYEAYGYDVASNRTSWRRRDGTTVAFAYDALNHALNGLRGETYAYDNLGQEISLVHAEQTESISFDALGRMTSETTNGLTMSYEYDLAGHRTKITWPDGFYVTYTYDNAGAITAVQENGANLLASFNYDDLGRRTWWGFGSPTVGIGYGYDAASRLSSLGYDLAGSNYDQTWTLAYNAAGQVKTRLSNNSLYGWTGVQAGKDYGVNGLNQYATAAGATIIHDARGNLSNDGVRTYSYDQLNNLTAAGTAALTYEPSGRLGSLSSGGGATTFLYSGTDLVAEYNGSTLMRRYVPSPESDAPIVWYEGGGAADRRWLLTDPQGSVVALVNGSGTTVNVNTYDEFGIPAATNLGRFQYTGQIWLPDVGLYHYKARAYSPTLGRFLQTDPIGYDDGMNWYAYVGNDPVNMTDPSGLDGFEGNTGNGSKANPWQSDPFTVTAGCLERNGCFTPERAYMICGFSCSNQQAAFRLEYNRVYDQNSWMWGVALAPIGAPELIEGGLALSSLLKACNCFEAGTLVATAEGPKAIERIKVGDLVLSRDEVTGQTAQKTVAALIPGQERQIWDVTVEVKAVDGAPRRETIHTTEEHPFRTADGVWTPAARLTAGAKVVTAPGGAIVVSVVKTDRVVRTYNLEIEGFHTYFVGSDQVWVHNACLLPTNKLAQAAAEANGWVRTKFISQGRAVFYDPKSGMYFTVDQTNHLGNAMWKGATSVADLASKVTRSGTYDALLNLIGP